MTNILIEALSAIDSNVPYDVSVLTKTDVQGGTALHIAISKGGVANVNKLLEAGGKAGVLQAMLSAKDKEGNSPIVFASLLAKKETIVVSMFNKLFSSTIPLAEVLELSNEESTTAIQAIVSKNKHGLFKTLLEGAEQAGRLDEFLSVRESTGKTSYHLSVMKGYKLIVEAILDKVASGKAQKDHLLAKDELRVTGYSWAVEKKRIDLIGTINVAAKRIPGLYDLMQKSQDNDGTTALLSSLFKKDNAEVTKAILKDLVSDASFSDVLVLGNNDGSVPLSILLTKKHTATYQYMLEQAEAAKTLQQLLSLKITEEGVQKDQEEIACAETANLIRAFKAKVNMAHNNDIVEETPWSGNETQNTSATDAGQPSAAKFSHSVANINYASRIAAVSMNGKEHQLKLENRLSVATQVVISVKEFWASGYTFIDHLKIVHKALQVTYGDPDNSVSSTVKRLYLDKFVQAVSEANKAIAKLNAPAKDAYGVASAASAEIQKAKEDFSASIPDSSDIDCLRADVQRAIRIVIDKAEDVFSAASAVVDAADANRPNKHAIVSKDNVVAEKKKADQHLKNFASVLKINGVAIPALNLVGRLFNVADNNASLIVVDLLHFIATWEIWQNGAWLYALNSASQIPSLQSAFKQNIEQPLVAAYGSEAKYALDLGTTLSNIIFNSVMIGWNPYILGTTIACSGGQPLISYAISNNYVSDTNPLVYSFQPVCSFVNNAMSVYYNPLKGGWKVASNSIRAASFALDLDEALTLGLKSNLVNATSEYINFPVKPSFNMDIFQFTPLVLTPILLFYSKYMKPTAIIGGIGEEDALDFGDSSATSVSGVTSDVHTDSQLI